MNISLNEDNKKQNFHAARGEAVAAFSHLEAVLSSVFGFLAEHATTATTSAIFFRITQQNTRMEIIERLQSNKFGDKYTEFWSSFRKIIRDLNISRNKIIHWELVKQSSKNSNDSPDFKIDFILKRQTFWDEPDRDETVTINDIKNFIVKCDFAAWIPAGFLNYHILTVTSQERLTWKETFSKKIFYPLDSSHPLFQLHPDSLRE